MKTASFWMWLISCALVVSLFPPAGQAVDLRIATGSKNGTYFKIAEDIQRLASQHGLEVQVLETQGSLHNYEILASSGAELAIMQSDAMGFVKGTDPLAVEKLRLLMSLYCEELHLLGNRSVNSVSDLLKKRLAMGKFGSGTYVSTSQVLSAYFVGDVDKRFDLTYEEAIKALLVDKIDAMAVVAGKPAPLFKKLETIADDPNMGKLLQRLHFIPVDNPKLFKAYYLPSTIGPEDYSWVDESVPTAAVKAVLVYYNNEAEFSKNESARHFKIARLYGMITANIDKLKAEGHPKWREVDLNEPPIEGWRTDPDVKSKVDTKKLDSLFD